VKMLFALQCHNFQRRMCWMLSSIVQQSCFPFDITIDIACQHGNGDPSTEDVAKSFNDIGLKTNLTLVYDINTFARRGLVRNIQVRNAIKGKYSHVYFADADHIYHPEFFAGLLNWINRNGNDAHACIFSRAKIHTTTDAADDAMIDSYTEMPYISNAYERALTLPTMYHLDKNQLAPGNMQVVAVDDIVNLSGGLYVDPNENPDRHLFDEYQKARSDMVFRVRIGKSIPIKLPPQVHLQHARDKETKHHIEDQR